MTDGMDTSTPEPQDLEPSSVGPSYLIYDGDGAKRSWKRPRRWFQIACRLVTRIIRGADEVEEDRVEEMLIIKKVKRRISRKAGRW